MKPEEYKVICFSTAHLTGIDVQLLDEYADEMHPCQMIMKRDTGWFIKLFEELLLNQYDFTGHLWKIIKYAHDNGYRMIEFDSDAKTYDELKTFKW